MLFFKRTFLISSLLFSCALAANFELPPSLDTHSKAVRFLIYLQREIPWILQEGAEYDIDLLATIQNQTKIVEALTKDPNYMDMISERKPLTILRATVEIPSIQANRTLSGKNKDKIKKLLKDSSSKLDKKIKEILEENPEFNHNSIISGLINCCISPAYKKQIFSSSTLSEQINRLKDYHKIDPYFLQTITTNFDGHRFGLRPDQVNFQTLIEIIEDREKAERDLFLLLTAKFLKQNSLNTEDIDNLITDGFDITSALPGKKSPGKLKKSLQAQIRKNSVKVESDNFDQIDAFTIKEVPPYLGLFRGIVGGDCSTSFSGGFSYAPFEHTYFVSDSSNNIRGYVQATEVAYNGKGRFLYLHDITGCRLSVDLLESITLAFQTAVKDMGYDGVIFPTSRVIERNQNYFDLREWQQSQILNTDEGNVTYFDNNVRYIFNELGTNTDYDLEESNSKGHLLSKKIESEKVIRFELDENDSELELPSRITKKEAVLLYLSLTYGERSPDAKKALQEAYEAADQGRVSDFSKRVAVAKKIIKDRDDLTIKGLQSLEDIIVNKKGFDQQAYKEKIIDGFSKLGVNFSENDLENNEFLFYDGYLLAAEFSDDIDIKKTAQYAITQLKRWAAPYAVAIALESKPEFVTLNSFKRHLASLIGPKEQDLKQLHWVLSHFSGNASLLGLDIVKLQALAHEIQKEEILKIIGKIINRVEKDEKVSNGKGVSCASLL